MTQKLDEIICSDLTIEQVSVLLNPSQNKFGHNDRIVVGMVFHGYVEFKKHFSKHGYEGETLELTDKGNAMLTRILEAIKAVKPVVPTWR